MKETCQLNGRVVTGVGEAAFFTQLDWVLEQCAAKLGFRPWPGTLNLEIPEEDVPVLEALQDQPCAALVPPDPQYCAAQVVPLSIGHLSGALILPAEDVRVHGKRIIEVLAPVSVKDALGLKDGDLVTLTIRKRDAGKDPEQGG